MNIMKMTTLAMLFLLLPGCAAVPVGIGLIPGAPAYFSSLIGGGQSMYETAVDERSTKQQMLDTILAGHAQAELYRNKDIGPNQITAYAYFGKLYLVGEYDSQEQLKTIYESMEKVDGKRCIVSRLYLRKETDESRFLADQSMAAKLRTQLMADFEVTSSPVEVEIVQGDIILLGTIADKQERDRIMAHAMSTPGVNRVISYLFHQENGGPKPHLMTAELPSSQAAILTNPTGLKAVRKTKTRTPVKPVAKEAPSDILMVYNPDRGR